MNLRKMNELKCVYKDNLIVVSPKIVCNRKCIIIIIHYITFSALPFLNCTCFLVSTSQLNIQKENRASHLFIMNEASGIKNNNKAVCGSWEASVECLKCKFTLNIYLYNVFITIYLSDVRQFLPSAVWCFFICFYYTLLVLVFSELQSHCGLETNSTECGFDHTGSTHPV